jgi:hypothetical protein
MIAMNDVPRHFNSTDTTDQAGAPVFQVRTPFRRGLPQSSPAKVIADIKAEVGVQFARRQGRVYDV